MRTKQLKEIEYYSKYISDTIQKIDIDDLNNKFDRKDILFSIYHQIMLVVLTLPIFVDKKSDYKANVISLVLTNLIEYGFFNESDANVLYEIEEIFHEISTKHLYEIEINKIKMEK